VGQPPQVLSGSFQGFRVEFSRKVASPEAGLHLDLALINERVDRALSDNRRAEYIVIAMATSIFAMGACVLLFSYWFKNVYVASGSALFQGLLYWPIREVLKLRRDNLLLQAFPALVSELSPPALAQEIKKMLEYLRR
jgi:hypothetical protein